MKLGERIKANYHWVIATVSVLAMMICGGVGNSLNAITLIPFAETLGVSRGAAVAAMGAIVLYSAIYVMAGKERKRFESEMTKNACQ